MDINNSFYSALSALSNYSSWIIGLSGGVDSVVLLDLAVKAKHINKLAVEIIPVHLNHSTRGTESDKDTELCSQICRKYNLRLFSAKTDVPGIASAARKNFEETAREERHKLFRKIAADSGLQNTVVLLAHHKDDQLETILMRLMRDAGWRGLQGIEAEAFLPSYSSDDRQLRIFRPLLRFSKEQIRTYACECDLNWREDMSNLDLSYERNLLRHKLIPALITLNPKAEDQLLSFAVRAGELSSHTSELAENTAYRIKSTGIEINATSALQLPTAVFCRFIEKLSRSLSPSVILNRNSHLTLCKIHEGELKAADIINDIHICRHKNQLYLYRKDTEIPAVEYQSRPDSFYYENDFFIIQISRRVLTGILPDTGNPDREYISAEFTDSVFSVSLPKCGETFDISGSPAERKISSILKKNSIPQHMRKFIPVLYADNIPIWLAGIGLNKNVKLDSFTGEVFCLEYFTK